MRRKKKKPTMKKKKRKPRMKKRKKKKPTMKKKRKKKKPTMKKKKKRKKKKPTMKKKKRKKKKRKRKLRMRRREPRLLVCFSGTFPSFNAQLSLHIHLLFYSFTLSLYFFVGSATTEAAATTTGICRICLLSSFYSLQAARNRRPRKRVSVGELPSHSHLLKISTLLSGQESSAEISCVNVQHMQIVRTRTSCATSGRRSANATRTVSGCTPTARRHARHAAAMVRSRFQHNTFCQNNRFQQAARASTRQMIPMAPARTATSCAISGRQWANATRTASGCTPTASRLAISAKHPIHGLCIHCHIQRLRSHNTRRHSRNPVTSISITHATTYLAPQFASSQYHSSSYCRRQASTEQSVIHAFVSLLPMRM